MKVVMLQFPLSLCFLLLVFNTKPLLAAEPEPVFDTHGEPLKPGLMYHVLPLDANTGGLVLGSTGNNTCPLDVISDPKSPGYRTTFSTIGLELAYIPTETDLTIEMHIVGGPCWEDSKVWKLRSIGAPGDYFAYVSTRGVAGNLNSMFKIERLEGEHAFEIYSFRYCPSVPFVIRCQTVGIYVDADGTKVMAIGKDIVPFYVRFVKDSSVTKKKNRYFSIA